VEGLAPLGDLCSQMRYTGDKIVCTNAYARIYEFSFNSCYYFGDDNISHIVKEHPRVNDSYICYDYIAFHKGGKHDIDYICTGDDFVREIWFYSSDRIDGNTGVKDACIVSALSGSQLYNTDYSETMARFKMEKVLQDNGIRGPINGYDAKGRPKYYRFKTSHMGRHKEYAELPRWEGAPNIHYVGATEEQLLEQLNAPSLSFPSILRCDYTLPA